MALALVEPPTCRVCLGSQEDADEELLSPCACRGTMARVHLSCLLQSHAASGDWYSLTYCPTCALSYDPRVAVALGRYGVDYCGGEFGPDSLEYASAEAALGNARCQAGEPEAACELLAHSAAILEDLLGPGDPRVARTLVSLGFAHGLLGDAALQLRLCDRALAWVESWCGAGSLETADVLAMTAKACARLGDHARSCELNSRALAVFEAHLGANSPEAAAALMDLGNDYGRLGDAARKRALLERALAVLLRVQGPGKPDVGAAMANLARAHLSLRDPGAALVLMWQAHRIFRAQLGDEDADTRRAAEELEALRSAPRARAGGAALRLAWRSLLGADPPRDARAAACGAMLLRAALSS